MAIIRNDREQYLQCSICYELIEITRKVRDDSETLLIMVERMEGDHAGCAEYAGVPRLARANVAYRRGFAKRG